MIDRALLQQSVRRALGRARGVVLVGPRQIGKSTLARGFLAPSHPNYFDLEDPRAVERLANPMAALERLHGLVVIDEVQRRPDLFAVLRVLMDREIEAGPRFGQFLLLGSASPALLRQTSESLLGRIEVIEVTGFNLDELQDTADTAQQLWWRGGYPLSYLASDDAASMAWRRNALNQFIGSDLPQLGIDVPAPVMMRFVRMLAHYHGQTWNAADPARSLGVSEPTVRRYLDHLTQTFMVRQLQPWHENLGKRQVKAPKIYFRDSGMLHVLMDVESPAHLLAHPRSGASWEGFALEQVLRLARPDDAYFWATHASAELDLLLFKGQQRVGVEFKRADAPKVTPSMRIAMHDLKLDRLYVVYPGLHRYPMADGIEAVPLSALLGQ